MKKLVSIIILNYNKYQYSLNCVKSLKDQTYRNFEVILIDNDSELDNYMKLKTEIKKLDPSFNLKLIRNEHNLYFGGGSNRGIKSSNGAYLCLLNNDVIVESDFIEKMVAFLEDHPEAAFITPKIKIYRNKSLIWNAGAYINYKTTIIVKNRGYRELDKDDIKYSEIEEIGFAPGTAVFFRRDIIEEIGLIDEIFFMYHEDPDWSLRALKKGYKTYYVPTAKVYHDVPIDMNKRRSLFNYFFFKRNSQILVWKHANLCQFLVFYYLFIYTNFIELVWHTLKRHRKKFYILLNAILRGLTIGYRRRTHRNSKKQMISDYYYAKRIQRL
ncbi:MAG: glycosyltransferase [Candidatus Lokiarchaeota archaeon]|nr:glycosyltransferase [Candidatus Lokiarchaeota archaeon]MBD3200823.1 glycosyltransferase [Candidatus Lokiarchaeota archaeon]